MKETDLAYVAGMVDADGCISVLKRHYKPTGVDYFFAKIDAKQVTPEAVTLAHQLGGSLYLEKPGNDRSRPLYRWEASASTAVAVLRLLLPYLRIKREQALNAIALAEARPVLSRKGVARGAVLRTNAENETLRVHYDRARELNRVGNHAAASVPNRSANTDRGIVTKAVPTAIDRAQ